MSNQKASAQVQVRQFKPGFEALGLVADFVAAVCPFGGFAAAKLLAAIRLQLSSGCHVAGFEGDDLIAYCGWMPTSVHIGLNWLHEAGELIPVDNASADAAVLTIVRIIDRPNVSAMIRACRTANPNRRVFFKRDYPLGAVTTKKSTVMNRISK